jgi:hypothetical protein
VLSGMSPGGGDSVPAGAGAADAAPLAAGVVGRGPADCVAGALPELLLQPAAISPARASTRSRLVVTAALAMSMPGRYREAGKRRRCAR